MFEFEGLSSEECFQVVDDQIRRLLKILEELTVMRDAASIAGNSETGRWIQSQAEPLAEESSLLLPSVTEAAARAVFSSLQMQSWDRTDVKTKADEDIAWAADLGDRIQRLYEQIQRASSPS